jgi:hypothetical protein
MSAWDIARMYNSLARFVGWDLIQPIDAPRESNKKYKPAAGLIFPFLIQ